MVHSRASKRRRASDSFDDNNTAATATSSRPTLDSQIHSVIWKRPRYPDAADSSATSSSSPSSSDAPTPVPDSPCDPSSSTSQRAHSHAKVSGHGMGHHESHKLRLRKDREEKWKKWCEARRWEKKDDPEYRQKVGSKEVHRSDAMSYFRLKDYEIDTLPHIIFENEHSPLSPGKSYSLGNLHTLVSRKFAFLAGLDPDISMKTQEVEFLRRGWELFQADTQKLEERMKAKGKTRKALVFRVTYLPRLRPCPVSGAAIGDARAQARAKPRPLGSWTSRVYEDGVCIGEWLNFQFDPDDDGIFYARYERFRPRGAQWVWVPDREDGHDYDIC
ncbi:hypothetical protein C8Q80DRAFT_314609 [Daedaleopsis nitida]|nr:hypothetical protein C8Q80DRAFT_314609 [Daedaleopsis nitida]